MYFNILESVGIYILIILVLEFSRVLFINKYHRGIKSLFLSFLIIISFLIIDRATEATLNYETTIIINCEMFTVLFLTYIIGIIKSTNKNENKWILSLIIITCFSHIIILKISGELIYSTLSIACIFIVIFVLFNHKIELIIRFLIPFISLSILLYFSYLHNFTYLAFHSIFIMSILNILFYEHFHRILKSYYHSLGLIILSRKIKTNLSKKILFWQTKLIITQLALEHDTENNKFSYDYYDSWIKDSLGTNEPYALEIQCHNDFKFSFILNSPSERLAIKKGETLKHQLQTQYRGLDAVIEIIPMTQSELYYIKHNNFYEIRLPKPPFLNKIKIIQSFINAFKYTKEDFCLYVVWKKAYRRRMIKIKEDVDLLEYRDDEERNNLSRSWQDDLFQVRIFLSFSLNRSEKERKNRIEGIIGNIGITGRNDKKTSKLKRARKGAIIDVYKLNFFSGRYITAYLLDFDLAKELPVKKKLIYELQSSKLRSVIKDDNSVIIIGRYIFNGITSEIKAMLSLKSFRSSALFIGKPNMGKTYLIANFLRHLKAHNPKIGVLIINLAKGGQKDLYPSDYCLKWGDKELQIPYAIFNEKFQKCLVQISECLVYSLGLKNVVVNALCNTLLLYYTHFLRVPKHINHLFSELLRYLDKNPYDARLQMRIVQAIKHRFTTLFTNSKIVEGLRVENNEKIPRWAKDVLFNGKKIMIDLSGCSLPEKRLLATLILQMFRTLIPDKEEDELKRIIVLDEAHQLASKPENVNPDDDDFIAMDSFRKIFSIFIREFRSKGTSLFLADQTAEGLYDSAINIPCLLFLFNQSIKSAQHFTTDLKEQELISRLDGRECMLKEGSESFLFRTEDFILKNKEELIFDYIFEKTQKRLD